jgi:hypothetical protein
MDNPEKLATKGTQNEDKQSKITTQYALDTTNVTKKGALDMQPQVIKFTSCLPMVGGSLRGLRLLPPLKLVVMI